MAEVILQESVNSTLSGMLSKTVLPLTIVVPIFNHAFYLKRTLQSVLAQDGIDGIQVIVSDDQSTDDSFRLASDFVAGLPNFICRKNEINLGIHYHYRLLLESVKTEFVGILEGDDCFRNPMRCREFLRVLSQRPDLISIFGGYSLIDNNDKIIESRNMLRKREKFQVLHFEELLINNSIGSFSNCMYRTNELREIINSDVAKEGYDWIVNLLVAQKSPIGFVPGDFTGYRIHEKGTWTQLADDEKREGIAHTVKKLADYTSGKNSFICQSFLSSLSNGSG